MAPVAYQQLALETTRAVRDFRRSGRDSMPKWAKVNFDELHVIYATFIEAADWAGLATKARDELRKHRDILDEMTLRQGQLTSLAGKADALVEARPNGNRLSSRADYPELKAMFERELLAREVPAEAIPQMIDQIESLTARQLRVQLTSAARSSETHLFELAQAQLTALMGATVALAVARFNEIFAEGISPAMDPAEFCSTTRASLKLAEHDLYRALRGGNLVGVWTAATDLASTAATALFDDTLTQAAAIAAARRAETVDPLDGGRVALKLGDLIRDLLRAVAIGHQVACLANCRPDFLQTKHWLDAATAMPFASAVSDPPMASIASLATHPAEMNGEAVTIDGVLGPVEITHLGRKAISTAPVTRSNGASVTVVIPHIKLDSGGIVPGAFVHISGTWKVASVEANGPALEIERRDFGALRRISFSDWATAQLRPVFVETPHGLAASWSWEPGVNGAGNQMRYRTWFAR